MTGTIDVYLITGFLGSGKTTFLNQMIQQFPQEQKLMILMNEFGEIGLDGALVQGEDLEILEVNKGSIFCACVKTDFIKGLVEIAQKIKPDVLIIESTGVANPTDLKKDLGLSIFNDCFKFKDQFCIIDAVNFFEQFNSFASVERQISSSTMFIINKIDLASPEEILAIKELVKKYHPCPQFYETTFANINIAGILGLGEAVEEKDGCTTCRELTEAELDQYIDDLLDDPQASITPPDILISATFLWLGDDLSTISAMSKQLPGEVVRAKGFLISDSRTYLYNYVMKQLAIEEQFLPVKEVLKNKLVFIFKPQALKTLEQLLESYHFIKENS